MNGDEYNLKMLLDGMSRSEISSAAVSEPSSSINFLDAGVNKISFNHSIYGIPTGFSDIHLIQNNLKNELLLENQPNKYVYYVNLDPLNFVPSLTRNGGLENSSVKENNYKLGILMNAQIVNKIYTFLNDENLKVFATSTTYSGYSFFKSLKINPDKFMYRGISLNELHTRSLDAAEKNGFKLK